MNKSIDYSDMNDNFSEQKEKLVALSHEISLLRQQVSYLLRNEKALGLLDLDVLMNRTHAIYDMLCAIQVGDNIEDEDLDLDPEAFAGLFGGMLQDDPQQEEPQQDEIQQEESQPEEPVEEEMPEEETTKEEQPDEVEEVEEPVEEEIVVEPIVETEPIEEPEPEPIVETESVVEPEPITEPQMPTEQPMGDEFGFLFQFEDEPEPTENHIDEPVITDDGKVVHFVDEVREEDIPARDLVDGDSLVRENPFDMPSMEDGSDEPDFEMTETLGDSLSREDYSLAAKLQQTPVRDLKSVIGINDKFLFVNELFGGSMEKYNKSIDNLNDLKTLNGAMIYLNELKIELQWNSSNEAYKKLTDLVHRKFE